MIIIAILSIIFGFLKLFILSKIDWSTSSVNINPLPISPDKMRMLVTGVIALDGLMSIMCGLYILFA